MKIHLTILFASLSFLSFSQTDSTEVLEDYSNYGEPEGVKRYATQKVLNQTPQEMSDEKNGEYGKVKRRPLLQQG